MFHLYFTAAYLIPSMYVYIRVKRIFSEKTHKDIFSVFFLILLLIFPFTEFLAHRSGMGDLSVLLKFGYYVMPYLLYVFITVLITDILIILAGLLKIISFKTFKNSNFRKPLLAVIFVLPAAVVFAGIINHNIIRITKYKISIPAKSSTLKNLRIAFAADFHIRGMHDEKAIKQFVTKTAALKPDIVLLGGDIFEGDRSDVDMLFIKEYLIKLKPKYGIFTVFGNHEYHGDYDTVKLFNNIGIQVLLDKVLNIDDKFYLIGRNDKRSHSRKSLDEILKNIKEDIPVVIVDHRPEDIQEVSRQKVNIQLSGHTHNGQLWPFNFIVKGIYGLAHGHKKIGNTDFFVTSGVQTWGPAVRTAGRSEIMIIDVEFI